MWGSQSTPTGCSQRTKRRRRLKEVSKVLDFIRCGETSSENFTSNLPQSNSKSQLVEEFEVVQHSPNLQNFSLLSEFHGASDDNAEIISNRDRNNKSTSSQLQAWALKHNLTHISIKELLRILRHEIPKLNLPKDPRTFLNTPQTLEIQNVSGGRFTYFKLLPFISKRMADNLNESINSISITVGIDGIPATKSSNKQFWPILGLVDQLIESPPFVIGLFFGDKKPADLEYLRTFIDECKNLENSGIFINGKHFAFKISKILADAPARSFLKSVKNHNSKQGCERCNLEGIWLGRVVFVNNSSGVLRTDDSFREMRDVDHHNGNSIFLELNLGLVTQFPLDYLHLVCLGVTKKLFRVWCKGKLPFRLSPSSRERI